MATVTAYTAERTKQIEDSSVTNGTVSGSNLILIRHDGTQINAGPVIGPQGIPGATYTICTRATRPTGANAYLGLAIYESDTKQIWVYDGTTWLYRGGTIVCTSTTRPASPFKGLPIYETDTDRHLIYTTATTGWQPPWNQPWGRIAYVENTSGTNNVGAETTVPGMTTTLTAVANRRWYVESGFRSCNGTVEGIVAFVRIKEASTVVSEHQNYIGKTLAGSGGYLRANVSPSAGSHTYSLTITASGANVSMQGASTFPIWMSVYDVGPNGNPV